jgi:hypothetical protein
MDLPSLLMQPSTHYRLIPSATISTSLREMEPAHLIRDAGKMIFLFVLNCCTQTRNFFSDGVAQANSSINSVHWPLRSYATLDLDGEMETRRSILRQMPNWATLVRAGLQMRRSCVAILPLNSQGDAFGLDLNVEPQCVTTSS